MLTLIDGYNLLFGTNPSANVLKDDRENLIHALVKMLTITNTEATIVFDAYMQDSPETKGNFGPLEMIFTERGEIADDFILKKIKAATKPHQILVVTSDRRLSMRARRLLAKVISTKEWFAHLKKLAGKKVKEEKSAAPVKKPVEIPKKIPVRKEHAADDMIFYLDVFEARYEAEKEEVLPVIQKTEAKKKQRLKKPKKEEEPLISDEERWLKAFEKKLLDDNW